MTLDDLDSVIDGLIPPIVARVRDEVAKEVSAKIAALPQPEDGEPGKSVTLDEVRPLVLEAVGEAVKSIPVPKDGKDADPVDVKAIVAEVVAQIPVPKDGKDAEPVDVKSIIGAVLAEIPPVDYDGILRDVVSAHTQNEMGAMARVFCAGLA